MVPQTGRAYTYSGPRRMHDLPIAFRLRRRGVSGGVPEITEYAWCRARDVDIPRALADRERSWRRLCADTQQRWVHYDYECQRCCPRHPSTDERACAAAQRVARSNVVHRPRAGVGCIADATHPGGFPVGCALHDPAAHACYRSCVQHACAVAICSEVEFLHGTVTAPKLGLYGPEAPMVYKWMAWRCVAWHTPASFACIWYPAYLARASYSWVCMLCVLGASGCTTRHSIPMHVHPRECEQS